MKPLGCMVYHALAYGLLGVGLCAPLTPSFGKATILAVVVFTGGPILLLVRAAMGAKSNAAVALVAAEAVGIVALVLALVCCSP